MSAHPSEESRQREEQTAGGSAPVSASASEQPSAEDNNKGPVTLGSNVAGTSSSMHTSSSHSSDVLAVSETQSDAEAADAEEEESDSEEEEGGDGVAVANAASAAQLFSHILRQLQGGGGDDDEDDGDDAEGEHSIHAGNIGQILQGLQAQGLLLQDEEGNLVLQITDDDMDEGEEDEEGEDEEEEEEGEEGELEEDEESEASLEEAEEGGAASSRHRPIRKDPSALHEFASYAHLTPTLYPHTLLDNLKALRTTYNPVGELTRSHRAHLAHAYLPQYCNAVESFEGRAFCGKFSRADSGMPSMFAAATQDAVVHLYETDTWKLYKEIQARDIGWSIVDIDFSADSRFVIYSSWSDHVHLINTQGQYELHEALDFQPAAAHHVCMFGIRFSPNEGREILAGLNNGQIILYDLERKRKVWSGRGHEDDINSVCWLDQDGNVFATGSDDASIRIWDRRVLSGQMDEGTAGASSAHSRHAQPVAGFLGHVHGITCVSGLEDAGGGASRYLLSNSKDQSMKLWDLRRTNSSEDTLRVTRDRNEQESIIDYRWQRVSRRQVQRAAAQSGLDGADQSILTMTGHSVVQTLIRCDFSPSYSTGGRYAVSGSSCGRIFIYDLLTGEIIKKIEGHRSIVRDVAWTDGASGGGAPILVSSSWDHTIRRHSTVETDKLLVDNEETQRRNAALRDPFSRLGRRLRRRREDEEEEEEE